MKNVHEKYYGQAVREIERDGVIRHDLWAKAGALSVGDREAAKAIYIDLLARQFAEGAHRAEREDLKQTALDIAQLAGQQSKAIGFKVLCWGIWAALSVLICVGGQNWADKLYGAFVFEYTAAYNPSQAGEQKEFTNPQGSVITEPTTKEYYQAQVSKESGNHVNGLSEMAMDSANQDAYSLQQKYGDEGARFLIIGHMLATTTYWQVFRYLADTQDYQLAMKFRPVPWLLLALACLGSWSLITWFALRTHRRGRFEAPLWMKV